MKPAFIKPQLAQNVNKSTAKQIAACTVAQPKLDGWARVVVHVVDGATAEAYSRYGRSLLGDSRLTWLNGMTWPVENVVLDCEAVEGEGLSWGQANVEEAQDRRGGDTHLVVLDLMQVGDLIAEQVMEQPFHARRATVEALFATVEMPARVSLVPQTDDIEGLWSSFVTVRKGEGIMLKDPNAKYRPGKRVWTMLKRKEEFTVDVVITGITTKPTYTDNFRSCEAALTYGYWSPKLGKFFTAGQGVKFGTVDELTPFVGRVAELWCNGVMKNGGLRFQHLIRWREDKEPKECTVGSIA